MMQMHELTALIEGVQNANRKTIDLAVQLFDGVCVRTLTERDLGGVSIPGGFAYHLDTAKAFPALDELRSSGCALFTGQLAKSNGVVLGDEQADLCCSMHPCSYDVCPVALAACFCAVRDLDPMQEIPLYDKRKLESSRLDRAAAAFRDKWKDRIADSDAALNLICSQKENDFSGMLVVEDEAFRDEFIEDLARILTTLGKIEKNGVEAMHLASLIDTVDSTGARFKTTRNENLKPHRLYVFDRLPDFVDSKSMFGDAGKNFIIERLGHIVDDRYVLLVGTEAELAGFCAQNSRYLLTFDQHPIKLAGMGPAELFRLYLDYLDTDLRDEALADPDFEEKFRQFVAFNGDWLPFKGRELADFLAKHANAQRKLQLPKSRYQSSSLDEMLDSVIGLEQVKDTIRQLEQYAIFRKIAMSGGREMPPANMHMLFMGNPGTGKTTVARIISTMLYKIGIIRQNKCIEVSSKDLVAGYVGQTDKKTHDAVQSALGGILFIDEAYSLSMGGESNSGSFGKEAIAELVKCMEDYKDDLIVIFAGYEREMNEFLETNPGLNSRIGYTFRFQDYTTDELMELFHKKVAAAGFTYDQRAVDREVRDVFEHHRRFKNFGNGRFVGDLVQKAIIKHADTLKARDEYTKDDFVLTVEDIPTRQEMFNITNWTQRGAAELLEPLVGMKDLKEKICEFEQVVQFYEDARRADLKLPEFNMHMVFTGNPGTGKTTVARIIAAILYNVGAVPTNKFIEIEAKDLTAHQFNSSQSATEKYLKDAIGGVLFIDEAYSLLYTNQGSEIIAQLVKAMEDHKGEFCVMFAGYQNEMREFIDRNPGLASRVGYTFHFEDYDTEELQEIFDIKTSHAGLRLGVGVRSETTKIFKYFHNVESFGNGRFVDKLIQEIIARHAGNHSTDLAEIKVADVPSISDMCKIVSMPVYEPSDVSDAEAQRRVAIHEMGHAICRLALTGGTDIMVVTIEQEGNGALGYVQHKASTTALPTAKHLMNEIIELMGGMGAEQHAYGDYSAGNSSDLQKATRIASRYVGTYGMSEAGFVQYLGGTKEEPSITDLPAEVQQAINALLAEAFQRAQDVIAENQSIYDQMVEVLLKENTISGERIEKIWRELKGGYANV